MGRLELIVVTVLAVSLSAERVAAQFYYGGGESIPLKIDSTKVRIQFAPRLTDNELDSIKTEIGRISDTVSGYTSVDNFRAYFLRTSARYSGFLDSLQQIDGINMAEFYYTTEDGKPFPTGSSFCVAFDRRLPITVIDSINESFKVIRGRELRGMHNVFVQRNTDSSGYRLLDITNRYYLMNETRYSHPAFGVRGEKPEYILIDRYEEFGLHIKKVIGTFNDSSVWDFGGLQDAVIVAVLDDGFAEHEDFDNLRLLSGLGYDFAEDNTGTIPGLDQSHGMAVTGIIAANHEFPSTQATKSVPVPDQSGVISLNPHVSIIPIRIYKDDDRPAFPSQVAEAVKHAYTNGADIIIMSIVYGWPIYWDVIDDATRDATVLGRGGLGCPVIVAAGNDFGPDLLFPSNLEQTFSVGAIDLNDIRWNYSSHGTGLDIVAPSGDFCMQGDFWTLDQMKLLGDNPNTDSVRCFDPFNPDPEPLPVTWDCDPVVNNESYRCNFGGTSAASPVVAGAASLLLARDPTLTYDEVYDILRHSAVLEVGPSQPITPPDLEYGYGRVDAFREILSIARGDLDADPNGIVDIADLTVLIDHLFLSLASLKPTNMVGNIDCDPQGNVDITDLSVLIDHLFISLAELPIPCFVFD